MILFSRGYSNSKSGDREGAGENGKERQSDLATRSGSFQRGNLR